MVLAHSPELFLGVVYSVDGFLFAVFVLCNVHGKQIAAYRHKLVPVCFPLLFKVVVGLPVPLDYRRQAVVHDLVLFIKGLFCHVDVVVVYLLQVPVIFIGNTFPGRQVCIAEIFFYEIGAGFCSVLIGKQAEIIQTVNVFPFRLTCRDLLLGSLFGKPDGFLRIVLLIAVQFFIVSPMLFKIGVSVLIQKRGFLRP